jgi:hypothetical protein
MKLTGRLRITVFTILSISFLIATATVSAQHGFRVKEYEAFHDVLHPLEHEALPRKDFKRIRAKSSLLVKRGRAIVRVGVPSGTKGDIQEEFKKELERFDKALTKFRTAARMGSNTQLQTSYSAVHDSFEMLAGMLR